MRSCTQVVPYRTEEVKHTAGTEKVMHIAGTKKVRQTAETKGRHTWLMKSKEAMHTADTKKGGSVDSCTSITKLARVAKGTTEGGVSAV